jgi:hypothetical protein
MGCLRGALAPFPFFPLLCQRRGTEGVDFRKNLPPLLLKERGIKGVRLPRYLKRDRVNAMEKRNLNWLRMEC